MHSEVYKSISFKDQIYREKLQQLKMQLEALKNRTHPDFLRAKIYVEQDLENRLFCNEVSYKIVKRKIAGDFQANKAAASKDFEEKKAEMKECLLNELEERKRQIEHEYASMDLSGDGCDVKQPPKRNLRRRNDVPCVGGSSSACLNDKRPRKTSPILSLSLNETEITDDLKRINSTTSAATSKEPQALTPDPDEPEDSPDDDEASSDGGQSLGEKIESDQEKMENLEEISTDKKMETILDVNLSPSGKKSVEEKTLQRKISSASLEKGQSTSASNQSQNLKPKISKVKQQVYQSKGKLYYHKKLYMRGQCVTLTTPELGKAQAVIFSIGPKEIGFKICQEKAETKKISVSIQHLQQGKCSLKHKIT